MYYENIICRTSMEKIPKYSANRPLESNLNIMDAVGQKGCIPDPGLKKADTIKLLGTNKCL